MLLKCTYTRNIRLFLNVAVTCQIWLASTVKKDTFFVYLFCLKFQSQMKGDHAEPS